MFLMNLIKESAELMKKKTHTHILTFAYPTVLMNNVINKEMINMTFFLRCFFHVITFLVNLIKESVEQIKKCVLTFTFPSLLLNNVIRNMRKLLQ